MQMPVACPIASRIAFRVVPLFRRLVSPYRTRPRPSARVPCIVPPPYP